MSERLQQVSRTLLNELLDRKGLEAEALKAARALVDAVVTADGEREVAVVRASQGLPEAWTPIQFCWLPTGGDTGRTRNRQVHVGNVVRVAGLGKRSSSTGERTTSAGWKITGMAQRGDEINVVVLKNGVERTVRLDKIR